MLNSLRKKDKEKQKAKKFSYQGAKQDSSIRGDIDDIKEAKEKLKNLQGSSLSRMAKTASKFGLSKLTEELVPLNPT